MTWTILILAVAVLLYVFAGKLAGADGKKPNPAAHTMTACAKLVAIVLIAVGVNRTGTGTLHYIKNGLQADMQAQQQREQEAASKNTIKYVKAHSDEMAKWAPVLGNEKATKTIFVWTAADCPYCRRVHGDLSRIIKDMKDVRVVIKNFPVHGEISDIPGRWTIAAKIQSNAKAAALYEKLMNNTYWDEKNRGDMKAVTANMRKWAKEVGLDVAKVEKDLNGPAVAQELAQVRELASQFNITGTPYLIIGDQVFPGAVPYGTIANALR
ncbi:MAG: DsbA family protein [Rickettsiales bacterium]|jgi:protein-disulfide isomerase|nr:DsbA family protein [Rickettsiales bacterium]